MLWHMLLFGEAFGPAYAGCWSRRTAVLLCVVYRYVRVCCFFFVFFFLIFNFELCACFLFAVCEKWVDFRGGDAVQQCNALLMFYV